MIEYFGPCLKPWVEEDYMIFTAARRWAEERSPRTSAQTFAVVARCLLRSDELAFDAPEAIYVLVPAIRYLLDQQANASSPEMAAAGHLVDELLKRSADMPTYLRDKLISAAREAGYIHERSESVA